MTRHESDVCIVGSGITATLLAARLSEMRPGLAITLVEAGRRLFDVENRALYRQRMLDYGENPWPGDHVEDMYGVGVVSRTVAVGGQALHWAAQAMRFSEDDLRLRSLHGVAVDWPLEWAELERYYCEAERRIGVAGEQGPPAQDPRSEPYPMPPLPLSHNLVQLKAWAEKSGVPFWTMPQAKNSVEYDGRSICRRCDTCEICPTGARYSPDYTLRRLLAARRIALHDRTLVRRLVLADRDSRVVAARAVRQHRGGQEIEYRARVFVLASGSPWSPHLLLLSACPRFPDGLANRSGLVGRYMTGHRWVMGDVEIDLPVLPGVSLQHGLITREFFRPPRGQTYVRHDVKIMEGRSQPPRLRGPDGRVRLGDALVSDGRERNRQGSARFNIYYELHPSEDSALTLDTGQRNRWGDPQPRVDFRFDAASLEREAATRRHLESVLGRLAAAGGGRPSPLLVYARHLSHPSGGCRMGTDPATSVCDSHGRAHDHDNLFVVGAPTLPTGGCTNATLTFVALSLRSATRIAAAL